MPRAPTEENAKFLALVREHIHWARDASNLLFPPWAPHIAMIELPNGEWRSVPRRRVTDLLEFSPPEEEEERFVDERQLELEWASYARLEDPPMTLRITIDITIPRRLVLRKVGA